jgi:hypothetical protein
MRDTPMNEAKERLAFDSSGVRPEQSGRPKSTLRIVNLTNAAAAGLGQVLERRTRFKGDGECHGDIADCCFLQLHES